MKTCSTCYKNKPLTEFYKQKDRKNNASSCKKCFNSMCVNRWIETKKKAIAYKGGRCIRCGYDNHYAAMQFHHRDPAAKEYSWTKLRLRSWSKITHELDKCDLLCANCHSIEHSLSS